METGIQRGTTGLNANTISRLVQLGTEATGISGRQSAQTAQKVAPTAVQADPNAGSNLAALSAALGVASDTAQTLGRIRKKKNNNEAFDAAHSGLDNPHPYDEDATRTFNHIRGGKDALDLIPRFEDISAEAGGDPEKFKQLVDKLTAEALPPNVDPSYAAGFRERLTRMQSEEYATLKRVREEGYKDKSLEYIQSGKPLPADAPRKLVQLVDEGRADTAVESYLTELNDIALESGGVTSEGYKEQSKRRYEEIYGTLSPPAQDRFKKLTMARRLSDAQLFNDELVREKQEMITSRLTNSTQGDAETTFLNDLGLTLADGESSFSLSMGLADKIDKLGVTWSDNLRAFYKQRFDLSATASENSGFKPMVTDRAVVDGIINLAKKYRRPELIDPEILSEIKLSNGATAFDMYADAFMKARSEVRDQRTVRDRALRMQEDDDQQRKRKVAVRSTTEKFLAFDKVSKEYEADPSEDNFYRYWEAYNAWGDTLNTPDLYADPSDAARYRQQFEMALTPEPAPEAINDAYILMSEQDPYKLQSFLQENISLLDGTTKSLMVNKISSQLTGAEVDANQHVAQAKLEIDNHYDPLMKDEFGNATLNSTAMLQEKKRKQAELIKWHMNMEADGKIPTWEQVVDKTDELLARNDYAEQKDEPDFLAVETLEGVPEGTTAGMRRVATDLHTLMKNGVEDPKQLDDIQMALNLMDDTSAEAAIKASNVPPIVAEQMLASRATWRTDKAWYKQHPTYRAIELANSVGSAEAATLAYTSGIGVAGFKERTGGSTRQFLTHAVAPIRVALNNDPDKLPVLQENMQYGFKMANINGEHPFASLMAPVVSMAGGLSDSEYAYVNNRMIQEGAFSAPARQGMILSGTSLKRNPVSGYEDALSGVTTLEMLFDGSLFKLAPSPELETLTESFGKLKEVYAESGQDISLFLMDIVRGGHGLEPIGKPVPNQLAVYKGLEAYAEALASSNLDHPVVEAFKFAKKNPESGLGFLFNNGEVVPSKRKKAEDSIKEIDNEKGVIAATRWQKTPLQHNLGADRTRTDNIRSTVHAYSRGWMPRQGAMVPNSLARKEWTKRIEEGLSTKLKELEVPHDKAVGLIGDIMATTGDLSHKELAALADIANQDHEWSDNFYMQMLLTE